MAQYWGMLLANRPDPDNPGGLGAEESGVERTGPTHALLFAVQKGGRWAEIGQYYDSTNDPVTAYFRFGQDPLGQSAEGGNPDAGATPLIFKCRRHRASF